VRAPTDVLDIFLQTGDFYFGGGRTRIRTLLGSCVAMTLWHPKLQIGGMCHYMLPHRTGRAPHASIDARYADEALELFLREVRQSATHPAEYQVKLFGGGRMFRPALRHMAGCLNVPERNVETGRQLAAGAGFNVIAEDLGGDGHRNVMLDLWSGEVWVKRVSEIVAGKRQT